MHLLPELMLFWQLPQLNWQLEKATEEERRKHFTPFTPTNTFNSMGAWAPATSNVYFHKPFGAQHVLYFTSKVLLTLFVEPMYFINFTTRFTFSSPVFLSGKRPKQWIIIILLPGCDTSFKSSMSEGPRTGRPVTWVPLCRSTSHS